MEGLASLDGLGSVDALGSVEGLGWADGSSLGLVLGSGDGEGVFGPFGAGEVVGPSFSSGWLSLGPFGPLVLSCAAFHAFQPGWRSPTTFGPPAHGGLPGLRTVVPSIERTSSSLEVPSASPVTSCVPPTLEASGSFAPHHHGGPTSSR